MFFGDVGTIRPGVPATRGSSCTGPGYSKVCSGRTPSTTGGTHLDVMVDFHRRELRAVLRERLGRVGDRRTRDEIAEALAERCAACARGRPKTSGRSSRRSPRPAVAARISAMIDDGLAEAGAQRRHRAISRGRPARQRGRLHVPVADDHPVRGRRIIPWRTASSCSRSRAWSMSNRRSPGCLGADAGRSPRSPRIRDPEAPAGIRRLSSGSTSARSPRNRIAWDQPHEGNLFDHLYLRRALPAGAAEDFSAMRILAITAGAGDDVLRKLPARQRAGGGAAGARPRRLAAADLHAHTTDEPNVSAERVLLRRRERVPAAARPAVPADALASSTGSGIRPR